MTELAWKNPSTNTFGLSYFDSNSGFEFIFNYDSIEVYQINVNVDIIKRRQRWIVDKRNHIYQQSIANLFDTGYKPFKVRENGDTIYRR